MNRRTLHLLPFPARLRIKSGAMALGEPLPDGCTADLVRIGPPGFVHVTYGGAFYIFAESNCLPLCVDGKACEVERNLFTK